jgi:hypothetical protein
MQIGTARSLFYEQYARDKVWAKLHEFEQSGIGNECDVLLVCNDKVKHWALTTYSDIYQIKYSDNGHFMKITFIKNLHNSKKIV